MLQLPLVSQRLRDTQQMTLVMAGPKEFGAFFAKEVVYWGKVVHDNDIKGG